MVVGFKKLFLHIDSPIIDNRVDFMRWGYGGLPPNVIISRQLKINPRIEEQGLV